MIDMRKILKKTATLMMTAVIGVSMSCPKMIVYAGQRMQMQERYTTPKEWNYAEITAYQFGSTDKFEDYLQTGGTHLYNDKFQEKDHMIKNYGCRFWVFLQLQHKQMEIDHRR